MDLVPPIAETFTGACLDLRDPNPSSISIEDIAQGLANQCRFNGQCNTFYSVAQHSVLCSEYAPSRLMMAALLHDAHEAYTGDIISPMKTLLGDRLAVIEKRVQVAIHQRFGISLTDQDEKQIKMLDLRALAWEKAKYMPKSSAWDIVAGVTPIRGSRITHSSQSAFRQFIQVFRALEEMS